MTYQSSDVRSVVFSPNREYLAAGSGDYTIGVWRVPSGECVKRLVGHNNIVISVVFSPDGVYLVSGSTDKTIGVWILWS